MKVFVYRNLNQKGYVYSVKLLEDPLKGRVVGHAHGLRLHNCQFVVSQAGRNRVLQTKRKNVHAGIVGDLVAVVGYKTRIHDAGLLLDHYNEETWIKTYPPGVPVSYNPYLYSTFVYKHTGTPIYKAGIVTFFHNRIEVAKENKDAINKTLSKQESDNVQNFNTSNRKNSSIHLPLLVHRSGNRTAI